MRRIDQLITTVRRITDTLSFTDTAGIQDDEYIQGFNDAQDRIYSLIQLSFPMVFVKEVTINVNIEQQNYPIPVDCYLGSRINRVEYSNSGRPENFYNLKQVELWERDQFETGLPYLYIRRGAEILIQPKPRSGGLLRVTYQKKLPRLDKRYGSVGAVVLATDSITSLTLDITKVIDGDPVVDDGYLTVVDKNGVIKMMNVPVDAIDATTGVVTISSGFTFESGETIAVGDFIVRGKFATTHSELPDEVESYLIEKCKDKIYRRDSSSDSQETSGEVSAVEDQIVQSYNHPSADIDRIPIISPDFLVSDWNY